MNLKSFLLILQRQFTQKWGRFLLASGGIMIGIWAITLTSSLSLGLSDTIIKAINSQPAAKEFSLSRTESGQNSFFSISEAPKFVPFSLKEFESIKAKYPEIVDISPANILNIYLVNDKNTEYSCLKNDPLSNLSSLPASSLQALSPTAQDSSLNSSSSSQPAISIDQIQKVTQDFSAKCPTLSVVGGVFQNFYESNRTNWLGKTEKPGRGEIVVCFKCGSLELDKKLGANEPKDLLNKEIVVEYQQSPQHYEAGKTVDVLRAERGNNNLTKSVKNTLKIVSVIDDRESSGIFSGGGNYYLDYSYFIEAIKVGNPNIVEDKIGFIQGSVVIDSYQNLDKIILDLQNEKLLPFSLIQGLIASVQTVFTVLTIVLSGFGLIALIASVFGIINVMTISVLERQKEIGILKSLGARDSDIFYIFLLESGLLGVVGWTLGTLLSVGMGTLISTIFKVVVNSNAEWKRNLDTLSIDNFAPSFPWWLLLTTFALAMFFTVISGVFPALKASKQNPVEVLRSE